MSQYILPGLFVSDTSGQSIHLPGTFLFVPSNSQVIAETVLLIWDGSAWSAGVVKAWNGTSWVNGTLKQWNGTSWVS